MKYKLLLFLFLCLSSCCFGQYVKLKKEVTIDTLRISMDYVKKIDKGFARAIDSALQRSVGRFNGNGSSHSYTVKVDSIEKGHFITLKMKHIKYANKKKSYLVTGLDLAIILGHVAMITMHSWTIPVYPFLTPSTSGKFYVKSSNKLYSPRSKYCRVNTNGYFRSEREQRKRFIVRFQKKIIKQLERLDKQNIKHLSCNCPVSE